MPFSTVINNRILDHFVGKTAWTLPTSPIYIGVSRTAPNPDGTNVNEPTTGGYVRQAIAGTTWAAATGSASTFPAEVAFPQATANYFDGIQTCAYAVFYTASTGGEFMGSKALTTPKPVLTGDTLKFPANDIDLAMAGTV